MVETDSSSLPPEILAIILSNFSTQTLEETLSEVCHRWRDVVTRLVRVRVEKIHDYIPPETLCELKTHFLEDDKRLELEVIKKYERDFMGSDFQLVKNQLATHQGEGSGRKVSALLDFCASCLGLLYMKPKADLSVTNSLCDIFKTIPCHHLIAVIHNSDDENDPRFDFYHESIIGNWEPDERLTYTLEGLGPQYYKDFDNYHDRLIFRKWDTRRFTIFKLSEVNHIERRIVFTPLQDIYLPLWTSGYCIFKEKVFAFCTTGDFCVWEKQSDPSEAEVMISNTKPFTMEGFGSRFYKLNNLIFVHANWCSDWVVWDGIEDSIDPVRVPMRQLLQTVCPAPNDPPIFDGVEALRIYGNVLVFLAYGWRGRRAESQQGTIFALRVRREPKKEDFHSVENFHRLIYDDLSERRILDLGLLTSDSKLLLPSSSGLTGLTFFGFSKTKVNRKLVNQSCFWSLTNGKSRSNSGLHIG